jgi:hypothetical protein
MHVDQRIDKTSCGCTNFAAAILTRQRSQVKAYASLFTSG